MGTPCIPPYCFWMLTKGSQRSFLGASDTSHSLPVHFVKQTRGSNQVNDVLTVPHWLVKDKHRCVLIATLEYEIIDRKLKVKIGGLDVMSSLMGKAMRDVDLIWAVSKVKYLEYPPGEAADPIVVTIFGEPYLIEVEYHVLDNITYVILESPVFRAHTKANP